MRLLVGGSPCTYWSIAQKNSRETEAEGMGWELFKNYRIAREKYAPDYFLYENNKSMAAAIKAQITRELGVEPILINSALLSAQNRERYYWTNIPGVSQPADLGLALRDVLETGVPVRVKAYALTACGHSATAPEGLVHRQRNVVAEPVCGRIVGRRINEAGHRDDYNIELEHFQRFEVNQDPGKTNTVATVQKDNMVAQPIQIGELADHDGNYRNGKQASKQYRVYSCGAKAGALCASDGGAGAATGIYAAHVPAGAARRGARGNLTH